MADIWRGDFNADWRCVDGEPTADAGSHSDRCMNFVGHMEAAIVEDENRGWRDQTPEDMFGAMAEGAEQAGCQDWEAFFDCGEWDWTGR